MVKCILRSSCALFVSIGLVGCVHKAADDSFLATAWTQAAGEYDALSLQAWKGAMHGLEKALADPTWTASIEQVGQDVSMLPPAIIVDVDETVLDNSPYQARLILEGGLYNEDSWREWVDAAEAEPLAGAVTFLQTAAARGVTVFYVTNRDVSGKEATRANLLAAGFPIDRTREVLLLKGENGWTSGKTARRALIAKDFRIVMLAGDDLNDFFPARTEHPDPRKADVEEYADWFGERWIVLPNPTYGSWEASLFGRDYELSPEAKRAKMLEHLRPW